MSEKDSQSYASHTKREPFYLILVAVLLACCIAAIVFVVRRPSGFHIWFAVLSLAALLLCINVRRYALKVQDRVIRLEERLRLTALLPDGLRSRIPELTEQQLISLRFAADAETPALVQRVLQENLPPKAIKQAIQNWRPDHWRV